MDVRRLDDPRAFLDTAGPFLVRDETRHNLLFGLAAGFQTHPSQYPAWHLWLVEDAGEVVGAALQTPPHNVVVAKPAAGGVLEALAGAIADAGLALPGVTAALPEAEDFARAWAARTGDTSRVRMAQGVYAIEHLRDVPRAPGASREAGEQDRALVEEWIVAFALEATPQERFDEEGLRRSIDARFTGSDAGIWLWEHDGERVSMTGHSGPTPNGIRIGPVYTPPALRGRGYATSLVAEQSAWLLANGRRFCFLYTDLANPTSNAIYLRIGYERVCDSAELAFDRES